MNILVTNIFSKKSQPTLGLPPPGGGGGDSAEGIQNFKKGRQATPPWGKVSKPLKKGLPGGMVPTQGIVTGHTTTAELHSGPVLHVKRAWLYVQGGRGPHSARIVRHAGSGVPGTPRCVVSRGLRPIWPRIIPPLLAQALPKPGGTTVRQGNRASTRP